MKYLILILLLLLFTSCLVSNKTSNNNKNNISFSIKDEINKSIIDGFFENDSTKIPKDAYFLK